MSRILRPNEPSVISEPMDEELVVINLESGCYYNLNPAAAKLWLRLESGASIEKVLEAQQLNGHSKEEMTEALNTFCQYLQEENLMIPAGEDNDVTCQPMEFDEPEIEKFSDMQEMLLLDPIHEVSEMGWPNEAEKK